MNNIESTKRETSRKDHQHKLLNLLLFYFQINTSSTTETPYLQFCTFQLLKFRSIVWWLMEDWEERENPTTATQEAPNVTNKVKVLSWLEKIKREKTIKVIRHLVLRSPVLPAWRDEVSYSQEELEETRCSPIQIRCRCPSPELAIPNSREQSQSIQTLRFFRFLIFYIPILWSFTFICIYRLSAKLSS